MRKIHWLASYPKSGNTWVRMFLAAYRYGIGSINQAAALMRGDNNVFAYQAASPKPVQDLTTHEALALRQAAMLHMLYQSPDDPVILKTHNAAATLNGVELCWEPITAGAVYLIRDPRDVALSYSRHVGKDADGTIALMAEDYARTMTQNTEIAHFLSSWSLHVQSWQRRENVLFVRYEDMLSDPVAAFSRIVEALALELDTDRVKAAVEAVAFDKLREQEQREGFLEASNKADSFFHNGRAGRWREELSRQQIMQIEADHGPTMAAFGYDLATVQKEAV